VALLIVGLGLALGTVRAEPAGDTAPTIVEGAWGYDGDCNPLPPPPGENVVDLGALGLKPGDVIDPFLDAHWKDGNQVHIPAGTYRWSSGGCLGGTFAADASLVGDGEVILQAPDGFNYTWTIRVNAGHVELRNITIKGRHGSADERKFRAYVTDTNGRLTLRNFNQPDGAYPGDRGGVFVPTAHAGILEWIDCHFEGFANNGIYGSAPGKPGMGNGPVRVIRGLYKNNNISNVRVGSSNSVVDGVVSIQDAPAPGTAGGARNQRGIRVREPGTNIRIVNCDVIQTMSGNGAVVIEGTHSGGSGTISNTRIRNDIGADPIGVTKAGASWTGDNIDISGAGDLTPNNITITNLTTGPDADPPRPTQRICEDPTGDAQVAGVWVYY
jgi:hypothetical protein